MEEEKKTLGYDWEFGHEELMLEVDAFASKSKLDFIKKHKLGKVLPEMGYSGMESYYKVAFDLKRLEEFDKAGVERYCAINEIAKPEQTKANKKPPKTR